MFSPEPRRLSESPDPRRSEIWETYDGKASLRLGDFRGESSPAVTQSGMGPEAHDENRTLLAHRVQTVV